jgi:protein-L-isoaspartate(D-aspartate) O-methyltransferase
VVTAAGPDVPQSLKQQLAIGGRLVMPVGEYRYSQTLLRVRRINESQYEEENLGGVRFVPLIGKEGWES